MSDDLRAEILRFAEVLNRGAGSVAAVDVAWKLRQLAAAPTTGPAPAAADPTAPYRQLLGAIWLYVNWHYLTKQMTTEQKELWADAVDAFGEPEEGKAERWWREPAAPQAPAQPTDDGGHRVAVKRSTTDRLFWMADCKDCPDSYGGNARKVADWAVEHSIATTPPDSPAAREGTAPPGEHLALADFDAQIRWADGPDDDYGDDVRVPGPLAPVDTPIGDFLTEHPEVANARVRIWFCPIHRDGTVDWRGETAHCTTGGCDLTSATLKTPDDWSVVDGVTVYDPDGWRRDGKDFSEPITHTEFLRRMSVSTVSRRVQVRRPPAPAVDGDTPTTPTAEES